MEEMIVLDELELNEDLALSEDGIVLDGDADCKDIDVENELVTIYLKSLGHKPLLTKDEVTELAKKIEQGRRLIMELANPLALSEISKEKSVCEEDEQEEAGYRFLPENMDLALFPTATREKVKKLRAYVLEAKNELITMNLKWVVIIAFKYVGRGLSVLDLIQEGNLGLMKAVDKYNYEKGTISTYATWWIRQAIIRALIDQTRTIWLPVYKRELLNQIAKVERDLAQSLDRAPTNAEIANELAVPLQKIDEISILAEEPVSLHTPIGEDSTMEEFCADESYVSPVTHIESRELMDAVWKILNTLGFEERTIIQRSLGIGDPDEKTYSQKDIGEYLGIPQWKLVEYEKAAWNKLRYTDRRKELKLALC